MKRILFFLLMCMLLVACADKRQGQIEKVLFMLNRSGTYYEMTTSNGRRYYLNVDSLLDHIDTAYIKTCKAAIALPVVQPLLDSLCSDKELYEFTGRRYSPVVRLTATDALIRRRYAHLEQILLSNYADTTMINVCADDVGWEEHAGSVFLRNIQSCKGKVIISREDSLRNDSLALYTPRLSKYQYTKKLLLRLPPKESYYSRIKEIVLKEQTYQALKALASYRREEDKSILLDALSHYDNENEDVDREDDETNNALLAVTVWACQDFVPLLMRIRDYEIKKHDSSMLPRSKYLFEAVMAYDNQWAYNFIDTTLALSSKKKEREYSSDITMATSFHSAMLSHYNPRFANLLRKYPGEDFGDGYE
ncbi:hypothetical protein [Prevotella melaninogenica]|uniref:hypothetical protein n=1 Tax=Prevotella melaninogenica TaxID=28132 RepID=UPI00215103B9|nr:hypothetical protein [Prevotella melaninogenica]